MSAAPAYATLRVRFEGDICYVQIYRPDANNTINQELVREISDVLDRCEPAIKIVVLEGLPHVFCFGADFAAMSSGSAGGAVLADSPKRHSEELYDLWLRLATGPYISVAHVRGKTNAGGMGFVAACDVVLSEDSAVYSLSEMLFGLMPACVMPFLMRRIGFAKANYLTLLTSPIGAAQAVTWGLADAAERESEQLLRKHLLRLRRISKKAVRSYKRYLNKGANRPLTELKAAALEANREVFSEADNIEAIRLFVEKGVFPWERP